MANRKKGSWGKEVVLADWLRLKSIWQGSLPRKEEKNGWKWGRRNVDRTGNYSLGISNHWLHQSFKGFLFCFVLCLFFQIDSFPFNRNTDYCIIPVSREIITVNIKNWSFSGALVGDLYHLVSVPVSVTAPLLFSPVLPPITPKPKVQYLRLLLALKF